MQSKTFSDYLRKLTGGFLTPLGRILHGWGVSPDLVTLLGLAVTALAGWRLALGEWTQAAIILALSLPMDALDGAIARAGGVFRPVGSFLDSSLDRYADALILGGLTLYYADAGRLNFVIIGLVALHGTYMVSYLRAKAESLQIDCKIGLFTRVERLLTLLVAWLVFLAFGQIGIDLGLIVLAIGTQFTALQRMAHVMRALAQPST